jgi:hypothetical protein
MGKKKKLKLDVKFYDYMDMNIPFKDLPLPKTDTEKKMLIERYLKEYGEDYRLSPWVDPSEDLDLDGNEIEYTREEMLYDRATWIIFLSNHPDPRARQFIHETTDPIIVFGKMEE